MFATRNFLVLYQVLTCLIRKLIQNRGIYLLVAISGELKRDITVHSFILMIGYLMVCKTISPTLVSSEKPLSVPKILHVNSMF